MLLKTYQENFIKWKIIEREGWREGRKRGKEGRKEEGGKKGVLGYEKPSVWTGHAHPSPEINGTFQEHFYINSKII